MLTYNYVETPTQPLSDVVKLVKAFLGRRALVMPLPLWLLVPAAKAVQAVAGAKNPIHPVRVRKAATPTHIIPQALMDLGFEFKYDFTSSLKHWYEAAPSDFAFMSHRTRRGKLTLCRSGDVATVAETASPDEHEVTRDE
jgi:hypothetical protein